MGKRNEVGWAGGGGDGRGNRVKTKREDRKEDKEL